MKILLAPSETKLAGGTSHIDPEGLFGAELLPQRLEILKKYIQIINHDDHDEISKMFGLKKDKDIYYHARRDLLADPVMKAVQRYTGVAFDYLEYESLDTDAQLFIDTHTLIFSNLFGVLLASDMIPEYRLQQGKQVGEIKPDKFYKPFLQPLLDSYLENEDILDLRAGFYDKYYKPTLPYTTLKFIKGGKVVSHWAKAYRGIVLREIASSKIENLEEFIAMPIKRLQISEIIKIKNKTEIIYTIEV